MNPEDRLLFACTRQQFSDAHREVVHALCREPIKWDEIYATADAHAVAPLIYSNLTKCDACVLQLPADIAAKFQFDMFYNIAAKEKIASRTAQVLSYLAAKQIQVMLIKGAALDALVYARPWYTTANDVDLVLQEKPDDPEVRAFLDELGAARDIQFEYDIFGHHDVSVNGVLPVTFGEIWRDAVRIGYREANVYVMSVEDMLIASCINSCRRKFFRLKALCDIAEIINTNPTLDTALVAAKARAYQCSNIVYAALYAVQATLGCELDPVIFEQLAVHPARARAIRTLCKRTSNSPLRSLFSGLPLRHRSVNLASFIPYSAYTPSQVWKKLRYVWKTP